jgi:hypothetical protein
MSILADVDLANPNRDCEESSLGMAREMALDTFRQETFATALTPPGEGGASTLCSHPRPKAMLALAGSFRWLISAFHKAEK